MEPDIKEIIVTSDSLLTDIQAAFSAHYPYLLLEFFRRTRTLSISREAKMELLTNARALADAHVSHIIDVSGLRTVEDVSNDINSITGAIVRISRKSGNVWNVISLTEGWTLYRQNAAGEYISGLMENKVSKAG